MGSRKIILQQKSDDFLVKITSKNNWQLGAVVEMMKRLKDSINKTDISIKELNKSSNRWSFILTLLTCVMLMVVAFQVYLALFYK